MSGKWAIVSARGGVGVSTLCANLSRAFALDGERTLLCDLAPTAPSLDLLLGVGESMIYTLSDIANGVSVADVRIPLSLGDEHRKKGAPPPFFWLLPLSAGEHADKDVLRDALARGVRDARPRAAVIDTEPGLLPIVSPLVDGVLLAVAADEVSLRAAEALAHTARAEGWPLCGFLLCGVSLSWEGAQKMPSLIDIVDRLGLPLIGILPRSEVLSQEPVPVGLRRYKHADFVRAVLNLRDRLCGRLTPLLQGLHPSGISREDFLTRA